MLLGVDTGGTFTDFVLLSHGKLQVHKVLSTPHRPEQAILRGIEDLGIELSGLRLIHGSTVATNAVLEGKGVRTVFITNRGLGDLLTIGRQARRELYNLQPKPTEPPVAAHLCLETGGRLAADGTTIDPLDEADLEQLKTQLEQLKPDAVAICLLFSFIDNRWEKQIESLAQHCLENATVVRSSSVLAEYREYERGVATWLNAKVGPMVAGYIRRLEQSVAPARLTVMQSSGGTMSANQASQRAVHMLLSGPAGGLAGIRFVGRLAQRPRLMSFDMGGTSTDVALVDGEIELTNEGHIGGYPVAIPMVNMHTIGAGGGSIAWIDDGGLLQVGPKSAGSEPGPACYGRGGTLATVTDANLVLGRLRPDSFLGGAMTLDTKRARHAIARLATPLDLDPEQVAAGIVELANHHMSQALRVISVQRGMDPGNFCLASFGGAGGLHVCALAQMLGMRQALVPVHGGVLSALGMLVAPPTRQYSKTIARPLTDLDHADLRRQLDQLAQIGRTDLLSDGVREREIQYHYSADLRYLGQSYTLSLPWQELDALLQNFHSAHVLRYGHSLEMPVELVNLRCAAIGMAPLVEIPSLNAAPATLPIDQVVLSGHHQLVPVYERDHLTPGQVISGPALITEKVATTYLHHRWQAQLDGYGNLLLEVTLV